VKLLKSGILFRKKVKMRCAMQKYDVGVIVGRFQVNALHQGHIDLINSVVDVSERVIVFLGVSPLKGTRGNPLDFRARKEMIQEAYPDLDALSIKDCSSDEVWSANLDEEIKALIGPSSTVALYGSRDAFIEHYVGNYPTVELRQEVYISGSEIRKQISHTTTPTRDFRAGAIWNSQNLYSNPILTVDIAIFDSPDRKSLLLGRKKGESLFRFIGGHVDNSETLEQAAVREVREETGIDVGGTSALNYLGSHVIEDWRYRGEKNNILTAFFSCTRVFGRPSPNDDIEQLRWFYYDKSLIGNIVTEHKELFKVLPERISLNEEGASHEN